jgi:hypothetical protein
MSFPKDVRDLLDTTLEVDIETRSAKGTVHRVPIWLVVDGDEVFARSYVGPEARWYRELRARPGAIVVGTRSVPVRGVPAVDERSIERTSLGFQRKYPRSPSLRAMQRPEVLGTTIRFEPAD